MLHKASPRSPRQSDRRLSRSCRSLDRILSPFGNRISFVFPSPIRYFEMTQSNCSQRGDYPLSASSPRPLFINAVRSRISIDRSRCKAITSCCPRLLIATRRIAGALGTQAGEVASELSAIRVFQICDVEAFGEPIWKSQRETF